jgi:hypothetical protein
MIRGRLKAIFLSKSTEIFAGQKTGKGDIIMIIPLPCLPVRFAAE